MQPVFTVHAFQKADMKQQMHVPLSMLKINKSSIIQLLTAQKHKLKRYEQHLVKQVSLYREICSFANPNSQIDASKQAHKTLQILLACQIICNEIK